MGERVHPYRVDDGVPIQYPSPLHQPHAYQDASSAPMLKEQEQRLTQPVLHDEERWGLAPPPPPLPRPRRRRSCCLRCCCCIGGFVGTLLVLLGILVLVFFLVVRPKLPKYTITQADITKFTIANATGAQEGTLILNAEMQFLVRMRNPNKKIGIDYRSIDADLFYDGLLIGQGSIPRLYQGHRNITYVELPMVGHDIQLTPSLGSTLKQSLKNDTTLTLHARAITHVRIKIGHWKSHTSKVRVKCRIEISNPTRGTVRLVNNSCKFKLLRLRL